MIEQEEAVTTNNASTAFRKSELVGALVHLSIMLGGFDKEIMPRGALATLLGSDRNRITRCIEDARRSYDLALVLRNRLRELGDLPAPRRGRPPKSDTTKQVREKADDQRFRTKGKRNRNMSLRPLRAGVIG